MQMLPSLALVSGTRLTIEGQVQGVGFRPYIQHLAQSMSLCGRVWNSRQGVEIELYAEDNDIQQFVRLMQQSLPRMAQIDTIQQRSIICSGNKDHFSIDSSDSDYCATDIPADKALCETCCDELFEEDSRRRSFAFNSCSECGPRYSIIRTMPYDRQRTSMASFPLCGCCQEEFDSGENRRFHTEAMSCQACGPNLQLLDNSGACVESQQGPIALASKWIHQGKVLALKGIGGFHLCCDAINQEAISLLRRRKARPTKPLAVMMRDIHQVSEYFSLSELETQQLSAEAAPIVLLPKANAKLPLPDAIAPNVSHVGVILAYSPLHMLLLHAVKQPLVMTSGNHSGEPLCISELQATERLADIADGYLVHDREIHHRCDDSLVKIIADKPRLLRRARGYVPKGIQFQRDGESPGSVWAMGSDLKNCFAVTIGHKIMMSGHNGDLSQPDCFTQTAFEINQFSHLFSSRPEAIIVDQHPDYFSSRLGRQLAKQHNIPSITVQHHHAHIASCLVENQVHPDSPVLGIVLDGLGYGDDGTLWGGELLLADFSQYQRLACIRPYPLLGGEQANRQPWRNLLAQLTQAGKLDHKTLVRLSAEIQLPHDVTELNVLNQSYAHFPLTSSAGRLFDAVAALLGIAPEQQSFEGEAAMRLEALASQNDAQSQAKCLSTCQFDIRSEGGLLQLDTAPLWSHLLTYLTQHVDKEVLAAWFHQTFVDSWVALVAQVREQSLYQGDEIVLSGGVFQNTLIHQRMQQQLALQGYKVYTHSSVPCNDAGLALGQCAIAMTKLEQSKCV
ncbi:MAG: carbamoyltransferase HypF [Aestuariibacter sp.]